MEEAMETDVVSQLHQLSEKKTKLSETFKDFSLLVRSRDAEIRRNITDILDTFHPAVSVGKIFKVKLIDRYRQASHVVQLLQCDDTLYIAQALKCTWFFEEIEDPAGFVSNIVPTLSLVTRIKVINKYASHLNTKAGDILYQEMKKRYGIKSAIALLPSCGDKFIRNELPNVRIYLPPNITLALYKRHPSLTTEYIKYLGDTTKSKKRKCCPLNPYESTYVKLAQNDLSSFIDLYENPDVQVPYMRLGRRPTKKLLKADTDKILENYRDYSRILVDKIFLKRLSLNQFKKLLVASLFPSKMSEFCSGSREIQRTLKFVKEFHHSNLILSAFKEKYKVDMYSDEVLYKLDESWIKYLPVHASHKWLENKISEASDVTDQASFLSKLPVSNCMPKLKKLIQSQSDPKVRTSIVRCMLDTIIINNDSKGIKDLFAYLVKRFRNEIPQFRDAVRSKMSQFGNLYLGVDDWTPIDDFINIIKLNEEASYKTDLRLVFNYKIQSAFFGNSDLELVMKNYLEFEMCESSDLSSDVVSVCCDLPCHKQYLEWLMRETPKMKWTEPNSKLDFSIAMFSSSSKYNKDHLGDLITIPDWILDLMESVLNSEDTVKWKKDSILRTIKEYPIPRFQKYISNKFPESVVELCRLLRQEPDTILQHIQKIVETTLDSSHESYRDFFKKCRMYDSFGITSELTNHCHKILVNDPECTSIYKQPNAVRVMALLLRPEEYMKVISQYVPDEKHIEKYTEEVKEKFDLQKAVCASFVDISAPLEMLPVIRKFAVGDFLKLIIGSLVRSCLNVPETKILSLLEEWINCPVSLRKHLLRLMNDVAPTDYRVKMCTDIFKTEKNVSLRLLLFTMIRKSFLEIPGDDTFAIYKSIISQLTVEDEEALKMLIDINGFEDVYISPYLELLWQLVDSKFGKVLKNGKNAIRLLVNKDVLLVLSDEFCDTLVIDEMTSTLPSNQPVTVGMYLLFAPSFDVQQSRLDKVKAIVGPLIKALWDEPGYGGGPVFPIRLVIRGIVKSICDLSDDDSISLNPVQLLTGLKTSLSAIINSHDMLVETLTIDLTIQLRNQRHLWSLSDDEKIAKAVAPIFKSYVDQWGSTFGYSLVQALSKLVPSKSELVLASELLSDPKSNHMYQLLAIAVLKDRLNSEPDIPTYKTFIKQLSQSEHPSVQVAANEFFHSLSINI